MINQAILSTWMKKHSIKFSVASDGKEAVEKWKGGGFHLILMDIQLPVMDGIAATKLIRSIEKERKIGVLPSNAEEQQQQQQQKQQQQEQEQEQEQEEEELMKKETNEEKNHGNSVSSFQSPVIIVALTASSLESDRRAALAAGCNDFLTKPVSLEWLEKKIMEWGCMQALIDFEGWRKWKRSRDNNNNSKSSSQEPVFPSSPAVATFQLRKDPMASLVDKETHAREKEQLELRTKEMLKDESRAIILLGINKRRMSMAISDHRSSPASRSNTPPPPPLLPPSHTSPPPPPPPSLPSSASPASQMTKSGFGLSSNSLRKRASDPDLYTRGLSIPKQVEAREHKRMLEEERLLNQWEDSTSISSSSSSNNNIEEEE
ncbi:MAG: hypothetical protein EXX96DRAFT_566218 [Benjaminiella poitrasii]|nr:MAG: hypothetical protein EXX96DRAFT_566218 [Benjaminiella poitrasii]